MNRTKDDAKIARQAWRKRPRKFAPKSKFGCRTCKIRRVKCDETWPSCLKCQSTGRTCDGYDVVPRFAESEVNANQNHHTKAIAIASCGLPDSCAAVNIKRPPSSCPQNHHSLTLQKLRPFMMLPTLAPVHTEALSFFELVSVKNLNEYYPSDSWRKTLMFFSQTVPSVRHAAVALALLHRKYHDGCANLLDQEPLYYYNKAIQLVLAQRSGDSVETMAITLLVCYLFTSFDNLAGNYFQALTHLQGGVELSRNIPQAFLSESNGSDVNVLSGSRMLLAHVVRQIRRLDLQAVAFLVRWTPTHIQETEISRLSSLNDAFDSLNHAADYLQVLVARCMRLQWMAQEASFADGVPSNASKELIIEQLETWSRRFEKLLNQPGHSGTDTRSYRLIKLLRLQNTILWILVSSLGPGREMEYDKFLPDFQKCVAMADDVAAAHQLCVGSLKPAFTPEVAILPILYIIGAKCRDPAVRQRVLKILRRQPLREAVWDSVFAARAVERITDIEESEARGVRAQSMEEIAVSQRIECVSWAQVVGGQSGARMELEYTFCGQEEKCTESILI
ncbi:putative C6 transcription factor [Paramyrothecium foliicola]|nr:putative C6 transcription factor [Paramyrothecium foliicola]